jgi:ubiquinone/menaquinone biosynthesis C-methylase UbiE
LVYSWERGIPASQFMPLWGYVRIMQRYMFAKSFVKQHHKILEAPCGFGYGAAYLSKFCDHVESLDIAKDNIEFGKQSYRQSNINWLEGDVTNLPYKDNEFDIYVSFEVFEHLSVDVIDKYMQEAHRVVQKEGKVIISTPNIETRRHINNPFHIKEYTFSEFERIIKNILTNIRFIL